MGPHLLRVFQRQVVFQLRSLLDAHLRLVAAVSRGDTAGMWFAVEGLLTAAANASKALWGQGDENNEARNRFGTAPG